MKSIQQSLIAMLKEHSARKHLTVVVGMIAIAMVISVAWSLHINGITLASTDPTCGLQEHVHTEACYDWVVVDGTESIDSTEGTEALESTEAVEAVDSTETAEVVNSTETAETIKVAGSTETADATLDGDESTEAGLTGTEEETDEASANAEGTGASLSASVEENATAGDGTESLTEDNEEGTEALMENATEDATEGVTEEATESPQPGDTKVEDGVTYVYELVCGLEEHVHTDECYPDDGEEDTEVADAVDAAGESGSDVVKSTTSLRSTNNTDSEEDEELTSDSTESDTEEDDSDTSEDNNSGIATISEDETEKTSVSLTASAGSSEDSYYFADSTTLAEAAKSQDESYIVYTIINGYYYVVSADDTLVKCNYLGDDYDTSDLEKDTANAGMYYWFDSDGDPVFKCTTTSSDDVFSDYRWTLSSDDADGTNGDGSGSYTFFNSGNSVYLAPEDVSASETLTSDAWWTTSHGNDYLLDGNSADMLVLTVKCTDGNSGAFTVELYDMDKDCSYTVTNDGVTSTTSSVAYLTTNSDGNAWYAPVNVNYVDTSITGIGDNITSTTKSFSISSGDTYTVTVQRINNADGETANYVITYYDSSGNQLLQYTANNTVLSSENVYVHVMSQIGTYDVSVTYVKTKEAAGTDNSGIEETYTSNNSFSTTVTELTTSEKSEVAELKGDFDVTYTFTNLSNSSASAVRYQDNFVFALNDGSERTIYIYAYYEYSDANSGSNVVLYDGSTASSISYTKSADGRTVDANRWRTIMNATNMNVTIRVTRIQNIFTVYIYAARGTEITCDYTITFEDDSFGTVTDLFLSGINCNLTNISISEDSATYDIYSYDAYGITGSLSNALSVITSGSGWSVTTTKDGSTVALIADSASYASFVQSYSSTSNTTFYLAKVREYTVYFDGTNGGHGPYNSYTAYYYEDNSADASLVTASNIAGSGATVTNIVLSTYADAVGNCYVRLPYALNPSSVTGRYNYYLQGWYDIYSYNTDVNTSINSGTDYYSDYVPSAYVYNTTTGQNYEKYTSDNWQYTEIQITQNSLFYADWVSQSYDSGITSSASGLISDVADTSNFVTTKVFDYNDILSLYSASVTQTALTASTHSETWTFVNRGSNPLLGSISTGFVFINGTDRASLYSMTGRNDENGTEQARIVTGIYSAVNSLMGTPYTIDDLFDETKAYDAAEGSGIYGMTYVGEGDYLFQYDSTTGYYYFDSAQNAAYYDQDAQRFYLFEGTVKEVGSGSSTSDFLPFNYDSSNTLTSGSTAETAIAKINYWFGMNTDVEFYLPEGVGEQDSDGNYGNQTAKGNDMVFRFMGDDDVWVMLDGEIVLDLGGVHAACYGEINFSTGTVTWVDPGTDGTTNGAFVQNAIGTSGNVIYLKSKSDLSDTYANMYDSYVHTSSIEDMLKAAGVTDTSSYLSSGSHTLTFYYMERGAGQSNAAIYFSISPVYTLKLAKVIQSGDRDNTVKAGSGITFDVYTTDDFDNSTPIDTATTDTDGVLTINKLHPGITYYLVETTAPEGFPLSYKYLTVYVDAAGNATVNVYTSSGEWIETLDCVVGEDDYTDGESIDTIIVSDSYEAFNLTKDESEDGVTSLFLVDNSQLSGNEYVLDNLSVFRAKNTEYSSYLIVTMTYANYFEYELPSTGSIGLFPYERAGVILVLVSVAGLLVIAFYDVVQKRRVRTNTRQGGYKEEKAGRGKRFTRTRDRPRERSVNHGHARDRPGDR